MSHIPYHVQKLKQDETIQYRKINPLAPNWARFDLLRHFYLLFVDETET